MSRVKGKRPPLFVRAVPDGKQPLENRLPATVSFGYVLGCGASVGKGEAPMDSLKESCGSEVNGEILLCEACRQTHDSLRLQLKLRQTR